MSDGALHFPQVQEKRKMASGALSSCAEPVNSQQAVSIPALKC